MSSGMASTAARLARFLVVHKPPQDVQDRFPVVEKPQRDVHGGIDVEGSASGSGR